MLEDLKARAENYCAKYKEAKRVYPELVAIYTKLLKLWEDLDGGSVISASVDGFSETRVNPQSLIDSLEKTFEQKRKEAEEELESLKVNNSSFIIFSQSSYYD